VSGAFAMPAPLTSAAVDGHLGVHGAIGAGTPVISICSTASRMRCRPPPSGVSRSTAAAFTYFVLPLP
jgi:hypothetical protein